MKRTFFILGRTPKLAILELQSLYPDAVLMTEDIAVVATAVDAKKVMDRLGGTVKIAEELSTVADISAEILFQALVPFVSEGKISFGLSGYGAAHIQPSIYASIKKLFLARGVNVRYVESKHNEALGSVVVTKQHLVELIIIASSDIYTIAHTTAVQDFEAWNTRDSARPASDPHRGMLPPKVARMIVNIALSGHIGTGTILDPFCGVGTVVGEALMIGATGVGFDILEEAVVKARKNIAWLRAESGLLQTKDVRIDVGDATHVSELLPPSSVDAIVTEPFMGEQMKLVEGEKIPSSRAKNIIKGLQKLYIGCLKEWAKILVPGGRVVMAMPSYMTDRGPMVVKNVVDRCEILGYTHLAGPIEYSRPQAIVRREFYIFQKK